MQSAPTPLWPAASLPPQHKWVASRAAGLAALQAFVPAMGHTYTYGRNADHGPDAPRSVSQLSPYLRRRLITEQEVVAAALAAYGPVEAEKFVQEVIWRGYFKGWLEQRPQVWTLYKDGLLQDLAGLGRDQRLQDAVGRAQAGQTGLACMDAWANELVQTGYLHNHTRMWFASIWIFTLGLPWRLGADFFLRHLLDGDAASNTLSWRWVAGLHTRGKPYYAQAGNIAHCTGQRFVPADHDLAPVGRSLDWTEPDGLPPLLPLRSFAPPQPHHASALLLTDEDGCLEEFDLSHLDICTVATLSASHLRSPLPVARAVTLFDTDAMADAAARLGATPVSLQAQAPDVLLVWARAAAATQIVTPYVTRGPLCDWLQSAVPLLAQHGIALTELQRGWDKTIWPHATAGFFQVKRQIPSICAQVLVP